MLSRGTPNLTLQNRNEHERPEWNTTNEQHYEIELKMLIAWPIPFDRNVGRKVQQFGQHDDNSGSGLKNAGKKPDRLDH